MSEIRTGGDEYIALAFQCIFICVTKAAVLQHLLMFDTESYLVT